MNIKSLSVNYSQKFNLGNYEAMEMSVFLHAEIEPNEPVEGVAEFLIEKAKESVYKQAKKVTDAHDVTCPSIQKYYMGKKIDRLPIEATDEYRNAYPDPKESE
jgi:hypothetical protein